jgi:hypothetical protein
MNCRRLRQSRLLLRSASSSIRRSTRFCVSLCGDGRYSPLDTICIGMGVAAEIASAPATRRCSRSLSQLLIGVLPCTSLNRTVCLVAHAAALDEASLAHNLGETHSSAATAPAVLGKEIRPPAAPAAARAPPAATRPPRRDTKSRRLRLSMRLPPQVPPPSYARHRLS